MNNQLENVDALVVEDHEFQRLYIAGKLRQMGANHVAEAGDGREALDVIKQKKIDLVLCDLQMPGMDGVQFLRELQKIDFKGAIILLSALESSLVNSIARMAKDFQLRCLGYLIKPLQTEDLEILLDHYQEEDKDRKREPLFKPSLDEIQTAIDNDQFVVFYQPKVALSNAEWVGVESLVRWNHPERGLLYPNSFIDICESDNDLIEKLTLKVCDLSLKQLKKWLDAGEKISVSINISASTFSNGHFFDDLTALTTQYDVAPEHVVVEVTETTIFDRLEESLSCLARLRMHGFKLSIDDFGTGFASMQQLSRIPFTELKLDRSFVYEIHIEDQKQAIAKSSISLAKQLKLTTVAEGIESHDEWLYMKNLGCDICQGYYAGFPMPAEEFDSWKKEWRIRYRSYK